MRDTGPVSKLIDTSGDVEGALGQVGLSRTLLGQLANQLQFAGLKIGTSSLRLPDGTEIRALISNGVRKVAIYQPTSPGGQVHVPRVAIPQPEFPEAPPPPITAEVVYVSSFPTGSLASIFSAFLYPQNLSGVSIPAPTRVQDTRNYSLRPTSERRAALNGELMAFGVRDLSTSLLIGSRPELVGSIGQTRHVAQLPFPNGGDALTGLIGLLLRAPPIIMQGPFGRSAGLDPDYVTLMYLSPAFGETRLGLAADVNDKHASAVMGIAADGMIGINVGALAGGMVCTVNGTSYPINTSGAGGHAPVWAFAPGSTINVAVTQSPSGFVAPTYNIGVWLACAAATPPLGVNFASQDNAAQITSGGAYLSEVVASSSVGTYGVQPLPGQQNTGGGVTLQMSGGGAGTFNGSAQVTVGDGYGGTGTVTINASTSS